MPYPNEHAARQAPPGAFSKMRRGVMDDAPDGISAIYGTKDGTTWEIQSIRASSGAITADDFREWLEGRGFKAAVEAAVKAAEAHPEGEKYPGRYKAMSDAAPVWGAPYLLEHAADPHLAGADQSWVEVVRSGTFYGSAGPKPRRVSLSPEAIHQVAQNFVQVAIEGWFTGGCPVGYNHASAMGERGAEATKAAARILEVEVRENPHGGVSLWGLFLWTSEGAGRVRGGEFAAISAELLPPEAATSKITGAPLGGWTLVGATLTNTPFIPGMTPPKLPDTVAASEADFAVYLSELEAPEMPDDNTPDVMQQLAEITGTPVPQLLAQVQTLQAKANRVDALEDALETATEKITTLSDDNANLADREKKRVLDAACTVGRIASADRESYWKTLQTVGEATAHRWFSEGTVPVDRVAPLQAPEDTAAPTDPHDAFLAMMDKRVGEGLPESEAYAEARAAFGAALYTPAES